MKHIFKKYEFQDESTAQTRIDALPSVEEDGVSSPSHSHTIVKLGHVVVTEGSYDEEGNEVSAPVLASNYSVDVLWNRSELIEVDEDGNVTLNLHKIYDAGLLQELIKFNHKGNFDRVMSFMVGMYHTRELYNREVVEILTDRSADDWFNQIYK